MFRIFRHNGQVTDRMDGYVDAQYLSKDADAAIEVANALGVAPNTITVEHLAVAPAVAKTIPPAPHVPVLTAEQKLAGVIDLLSKSKVLDATDKAALEAFKA